MNNRIRLLALTVIMIVNITQAGNRKEYGKQLTLKDTTQISAIFATPEDYLGQKVLVQGIIVDVCPKRGCWIELASDKPFETIKVKVKDGEIVFPMSAKGKDALVEGEVQKLIYTEEQYMKVLKHEAEEHGKEFDSTKVVIKEEDLIIYRLKGWGAVIDN